MKSQSDEQQNNQDGLSYWPQIQSSVVPSEQVEVQVQQLLSDMTLKQKVAQIIQPEIRDITVEDMREYGFGSYLNGGGAFPNANKHATPEEWVALAEALYQASIDDSIDGSTIPTMWGTDAVHGHNNVIGATLFPHNIGLGAARNPELVKQIANATAKEVMATGIDWIFAPTVAVARDDRWGRSYESYAEDPAVVRDYAAAIVEGLQGTPGKDFLDDQHVISTVKHFIGDGGTQKGDDQGDNLASEQDLVDIHAQGYVGGLNAGAQSVMASFNSWHGEKVHGSKYLLTDVLKDRMGFDGFVVGDWNGHGQIPGCSNDNCPDAINAGLDVYMVPTQAWKPLFHNLVAQVGNGTIPMSRLDDAVSRVLRVKVRAGLFDKPSPAQRPLSGKRALIGHADHRAIARQAVRESLVLLKNHNNLLPLAGNQTVLVAGDAADNIGKQSGGWSITWQGTGNQNSDFPGGTSIYAGIEQTVTAQGGTAILSPDGSFEQKPDVAIVVFGEEPYAEGHGDLDNLEYQRGNKRDLALLQSLKSQGIPVVSVFISGRPLWVNPELNQSDAFVAAWLPGSEGQGVADVLFQSPYGAAPQDFVGKLSFSWPAEPSGTPLNLGQANYQPLFPYGYGLTYGQVDKTQYPLNETVERDNTESVQHNLFVNKVASPWKWTVQSDGADVVLASNTYLDNKISVRTVDRFIQEDAMQIEWPNNSTSTFGLSAPFPNDWRKYQEQNMAMAFDYQWVNGADSVNVAIRCQDSCQHVNTQLQQDGQWHQVTIALSCFEANDGNFASVFSALQLGSDQALTLKVSNIMLVPQADTLIQCP